MVRLKLSSGGNGQLSQTKGHLDFVVAERPVYVPGSGPPLAPISVMPPKDRDGLIVDKVQIYNELRYIVTYEDQPHLRISVQPQNILDWASPRALEEFEHEDYETRESEREAIELPLIEAKEERRRKRLEKLEKVSASRANAHVLGSSTKKRKRGNDWQINPTKIKKRTPITSQIRRRVGSLEGEEDEKKVKSAFTSPHQMQQQQPSLSTPSRSRGLAIGATNQTALEFVSETEEDEDSAAEEYAIANQLQREQARQPSKSHRQQSRSMGSSPGSLSDTLKDGRGSSKISRNRLNPHAFFLSNKDTNSPSQEAHETHGKLSLKDERDLSIREKFSYKAQPSQFKTSLPTKNTSRFSANEPIQIEESDSEESEDQPENEYEIKAILGDETRIKNGVQETWYLIDWEGDWDPSWEPHENVGADAIVDYEKRLKKKKRLQGHGYVSHVTDESDPDSLFVSEKGKAKGKEATPMRDRVIELESEQEDFTF
jgi:hypothetical protein